MFSKVQDIATLDEGDTVADIFIIREKGGLYDYAGGSKWRFELKIGDSSGEIFLKYWGSEDKTNMVSLYNSFFVNDVIFVQGKISSFNNNVELSVNQSNELKRLAEHEYETGAFVKKSPKNINLLWQELLDLLNLVNEQELKRVLESFFHDLEFSTAFRKSPASMYRHHACVGGLLEHNLNVAKISLELLKIYPGLNSDLLITGALLHDIGKVKQFDVHTSIEINKDGNMLGQVVLGLEMLNKNLERSDLKEKTKLKLKNILASSLGKKHFGAPKTPAIPEALVISIAKELDAKTSFMLDLIKDNKSDENFFFHKDFGNIFLD